MASSNFQYNFNEHEEVPEKVDSVTFNKICEKVLAFSKQEL